MYSISVFAGLLIKQAREEKGWSQQYLADELEMDLRTIKKIESGDADPNCKVIGEFIHLLNISPSVMFKAEHTDTGLAMDRLFRQLTALSVENIDLICESAKHIRHWRDVNDSKEE